VIRKAPTHLFSVDVEDYFHVSAFERVAPRETWDSFPSRVVGATHSLLRLLEAADARATFFVLGWVAHRHPQLVRDIRDGGHEVASHGYWHRRLTTMTPDEFHADVAEAKAVLEDLVGAPVQGFRAPSFSLVPGMEWAFDALLDTGHTYDASIFPFKRTGYGYEGAAFTPYRVHRPAGTLVEIPALTLHVRGRRFPAAGGGYLRHLPMRLMADGIRQTEARGAPAMLYIHPWEVDPEQPRMPVGPITKWRHYGGLSQVRGKLERVLARWRFTSAASWMADEAPQRPSGATLSLDRSA
jgi:polysaccharide deacetylase family protein (PEP-CTERM system associated)